MTLELKSYITQYDIKPQKSAKVLNLRRWKIIRPYADNSLEVIIRDKYLTILNYDVETFIKEIDTPMYMDIEFFDMTKFTVLCPKCEGRGVISWVDNAVTNPAPTNIPETNTYRRNPKGAIRIFESIAGNKIFASTPIKPNGFETCPACFATGLKGVNEKYYKFLKIWR